jgi:hypothetical protein
VSNSGPLQRFRSLAFTALLLLTFLVSRVPAEEYRSPSDGIQLMRYEEGLLSLEAKNASLEKVLTELSRMAMITIISDGPLEDRVTVFADRLPLDKALRRILRGKDTTFMYAAQDETSPTRYAVQEVRIYVAKAEKGEARRYSYESKKKDRPPRPSRARRRPSPRPNKKPSRLPAATTPPPIPDIESNPDARRLFTELIEGNLDELDEIAERLKEANPEVEEEIDEFLDTLEEARIRAEEGGRAMEGVEHMQMLMQQILRRREMSSGEEE